ncbi:MAG: hypothetical protein IJU90_04965 [Bacteroidales bacterium]|nr:hypothetical protein [Bacteroidales bacterium]
MKIKLDGILDTVKKGKDLWDSHGEEIKDAVKKAIPKKGKKMDITGIVNAVKVGKDVWDDSGKDLALSAKSLISKEEVPEAKPVVAEEIKKVEKVPEQQKDTFFDDKLGTMLDTVKTTDPRNPEEVLAAISTLAQVSNETIKYVAEQETKREEIHAKRDVAIARINAMSDSIKLYLEKTFDERSAIFSKQFEAIDEALRTGNTEMLALTLNSINTLAASSPFKSLADIGQVQQALTDGNTEWDI